MSMTAREFMDTMENLINSPNQRLNHKQLLSDIRKLHDQGKSEKEISDALGIGSVAKLRNLKAKLIREEKAE